MGKFGRILLSIAIGSLAVLPTASTALKLEPGPYFRYKSTAYGLEGPATETSDPVVPGVDPTLYIYPPTVATVGEPWSVAYIATNVNAISSFGAFPPGLVIDAHSRSIAGRPDREGSFTFRLKGYARTDLETRSAFSNMVTVEVRPKLTLTASPLQPLMVGDEASVTITSSQPSKTKLSLEGAPSWLTLAGDRISGVAPGTGSWSVTAHAVNDLGQTASVRFAVNVHDAPAVEYRPTVAVRGQPYSLKPLPTGLDPQIRMETGQLPTGLTMDLSGVITGTPTILGSYPFSVKATKRDRSTVSGPFMIEVQDTPITVTAGAATAYLGSPLTMSTPPSASGAKGPFTWNVTGLPPGVAFDPATGVLSGVPASEGDFEVLYAATAEGRTGSAMRPLHVFNPEVSIPSARIGMVGRGISAPSGSSLSASAGNAASPVRWSLRNAPAWASITSAGLLRGTPDAIGSYSFEIVATDANGVTATAPFGMSVNPRLVLTPPTFGATSIGAPITVTSQPTAAGGDGTYAWSVSGGPAWLNVSSSSGEISGTAATGGTSSFTLQVRDGEGYSEAKNLSVTVMGTGGGSGDGGTNPGGETPGGGTGGGDTGGGNTGGGNTGGGNSGGGDTGGGSDGGGTNPGALSVSAPTTGVSVIGGSLKVTRQPVAAGGVTPYLWSVSGAPSWVRIDPSSGALSGTPTAVGTPMFKVVLTDAAGNRAESSVSAKVNGLLSLSAPPSFAGFQFVGDPVSPSAQPAATGGDEEYSWSLGDAPGWLSIHSATGRLTGTPNDDGSWTPTVTVRDGTGRSVSAQFTVKAIWKDSVLKIVPPAFPPSQVIGSPLSVSSQPSYTGGKGSVTWSSSSAPEWLTVDGPTGILWGTVAAPTTFNLIASDTEGQTDSVSVFIDAVPPFMLTLPTFKDFNVGEPMATVTEAQASGGRPPYTWSLASGPAWISINTTTGRFSGVPAVKDAGNSALTLKVSDSEGRSKQEPMWFVVYDLLALTPPDIMASVDKPIEADTKRQPVATGGKPGYTFAIEGAPEWMSIDPATGRLTGTPREEGTHTFTVSVTDAAPKTISVDITFTVLPSTIPALVLNAPVLAPAQTVGKALHVIQDASATGGYGKLTWAIENAPAWLSVGANGALSGTIGDEGPHPVILRVSDATGKSTSQTVTIKAEQPILVAVPAVPPVNVDDEFSVTPIATGGKGPFTWAKSSGPAWVSVDQITGTVRGMPPSGATGIQYVTISATDSLERTASKQFSFNVYQLGLAPPAIAEAQTSGLALVVSKHAVASGGVSPYRFTSADAPSWMTITETTGTIGGTIPLDVSGTVSFSLTVSDSNGGTKTVPVSFAVDTPMVVAYPTIPTQYVGETMSVQPTVTGGKGPYTWAKVTASTPAWVLVDKTTGIVGGTPPAGSGGANIVTRTVEVEVTDALNRKARGSAPFDLAEFKIAGPVLKPPQSVGNPISITSKASASGSTGYVWSSPDAPAWLTVDPSTGTMNGDVGSEGTTTFTLVVTDAGNRTRSAPVTFTAAQPVMVSAPEFDRAYQNVTVTTIKPATATGGVKPYKWTASGMPYAMTIDQATGAVGGYVTAADLKTYNFTITVTDAEGRSTPVASSVTVYSRPTLTVPWVGGYVMNEIEHATPTSVKGGTAPYVFSIVNPPSWLRIDSATGTVSGIPTIAGDHNFTMEVADAYGAKDSKSFVISVYDTNLSTWGRNAERQLGDGTTTERSTPYPIGMNAGYGWTAVSSSGNNTCGIDKGDLYCWGPVATGAIPVSTGRTPERIGTDSDWTAVAQGANHGCGIRSGEMYCWGANASGQLGTGSTSGVLRSTIRVGTDSDWEKVTVAAATSCGIKSNGDMYCWGSDANGLIADGETGDKYSPTLVTFGSGRWTDAALNSNNNHICAIQEGGLYCWGKNSASGQLGTGATTDQPSPVRIGTESDWTNVSTAFYSSCAIRSKVLYCWGINSNGTAGVGNTGYQPKTPMVVAGGYTNWTAVSIGTLHTCGIDSGRLFCWGYNKDRQLGLGHNITMASPIQVGTATNWEGVSAGGSHGTAFRKTVN